MNWKSIFTGAANAANKLSPGNEGFWSISAINDAPEEIEEEFHRAEKITGPAQDVDGAIITFRYQLFHAADKFHHTGSMRADEFDDARPEMDARYDPTIKPFVYEREINNGSIYIVFHHDLNAHSIDEVEVELFKKTSKGLELVSVVTLGQIANNEAEARPITGLIENFDCNRILRVANWLEDPPELQGSQLQARASAREEHKRYAAGD